MQQPAMHLLHHFDHSRLVISRKWVYLRSEPLFSYPIARASAPAPRVFTLKGALAVHFRGRAWSWN
jgi:hypothetical protein